MEILRDPIWQSIGAIIGFIGIGIAIYSFLKLRRTKQVICEVMSNSSIVSVSNEIQSDIQIHYKGKLVQDLRLILIRLQNTGDLSISSIDFEEKINFSVGQEAEILDVEVVETNPKSLHPQIVNLSNSITIEPILLNPTDSFTLKIIALRATEDLSISARIVGLRDITITKTVAARNLLETFPLTTSGISLALLGIVVYWAAIVFATSSPGTVTDLVSRSTLWAAFLGLIVGIVWSSLIFPLLVGFIRKQSRG